MQPGDLVEAEWAAGYWIKARIVAIQGNEYLVHFVDDDPHWESSCPEDWVVNVRPLLEASHGCLD